MVEFLNFDKFRHIVDKYKGNRYVKHFTCWNQLLTLMFSEDEISPIVKDENVFVEVLNRSSEDIKYNLQRHIIRSAIISDLASM